MTEPAVKRLPAVKTSRDLARLAVKAYLCTLGGESQSETAGWPSASLVTIATAWDASPVLLLSNLANHTQNIDRDMRATILFDGTGGYANPQQGPRAAFMGTLKPTRDKFLHERFLARHPEARLYAGFGDFGFYKMKVERVHFVGGFARANWLKGGAVTLPAKACTGFGDLEKGALAHMNADHADAVAAFGRNLLGRRGKHWRMIAIDPEGCDLRCGSGVHRLPFGALISDSKSLRRRLVELAEQARKQA
ncbi:MAG: DUF2470 domain-containing protein [Rhodospirillales bacterium]|nr:DUF2470 domain-containing protein [Rhodospirillales bacterium]